MVLMLAKLRIQPRSSRKRNDGTDALITLVFRHYNAAGRVGEEMATMKNQYKQSYKEPFISENSIELNPTLNKGINSRREIATPA